MKYWQFNKIPMLTEYNFNEILERFQKHGISGLVRENIQNSLDGKNRENDLPVKVTIRTGNIRVDQLPGIEEVKERINALKGFSRYTNNTIIHMQKAIKSQADEIPFISFEDENTKGLAGAEYAYSQDKENTYSSYAYSKGMHSEEEDDEIEKSRGGSHGVGKIASNAASDIFLMYFANCDAKGNKHLGGAVQLIEHEYKNENFRSTGYFTDEINGNFKPFKNNFSSIFSKDTRGLKILIPFLRENFQDDKEIIRAICDSFFMAIYHNKLTVEFNGQVIDKESIVDYINDENYYIQAVEETKKNFTPLYLDTYLNHEKHEITVLDRKKNQYNFDLFFQYNPAIKKGRMAVIRTVGMKIEDRKVKNCATKPFNAVLIPKGIEEDSFIKSLENESHIKLEIEHIKDLDERNNARTFLNKLSAEVHKIIDNKIRELNPVDGKINTQDILYDVENSFKKQLKKRNELVKLKNGLSLTKSTRKKPETGKKKDSGSKDRKPSTRTRRRRDQNGVEKKHLEIRPNIVKRLLLNNKEKLKINLLSEKLPKNLTKCNLNIKVVDGQGKICEQEFDSIKNYLSAKDIFTNQRLKINQDGIESVTINNGKIELEMQLKQNYNHSLKFIYYLEV